MSELTGHAKIADILCRRDNYTLEDAEKLIESTVEEILSCNGDYDTTEDIMMCNLGLEMDYIFDLIG